MFGATEKKIEIIVVCLGDIWAGKVSILECFTKTSFIVCQKEQKLRFVLSRLQGFVCVCIIFLDRQVWKSHSTFGASKNMNRKAQVALLYLLAYLGTKNCTYLFSLWDLPHVRYYEPRLPNRQDFQAQT